MPCHPTRARWQDAFFNGFCWLGFMLASPRLHSTWLSPVGEACTISPAGSALILVQDDAATIFVTANTGAMLDIGQERSMK
jgi:hypothetical protein